jgi:hypothetical protein
MISTQRLSDLFVDLADAVVVGFDRVQFLSRLCEHASTLSGADAVGIVLADHPGHLRFAASSPESVRALEVLQIPAQGTMFAPEAIAAGFEWVRAFPLRLRQEVIGALYLLHRGDLALDEQQQRVIQSLADIATISILQERSLTRAEAVNERLQEALDRRVVVEQAKGALARSEGIGVDDAFTLLTQRARSSRRRIVEVAAAVLGGESVVPDAEAERPAELAAQRL